MKFSTLVAFAILLSFANGAPSMRRYRRQYESMQDDPFGYPHKIPWKNSCGIRNDTMMGFVNSLRNRTAKPLKGLRNEIPNYRVRLNTYTKAIVTDDVRQWFSEPFNSSYSFLAQINESISNIHLRKRHIETQIYVAAFQYLGWKQLEYDKRRNENINTIKALENLLTLAKNLLCEIETAINNTGMKVPITLSHDAMFKRLTFRNNNRDRTISFDVDEFDTKFAKIRFSEYLKGLEQILKNRMGHKHPKSTRKHTQLRKKVGGVISSANAAASATPVNRNGVAQQHHRNHHLKNTSSNNHSVNSTLWPKRHHPIHHGPNRHRNRPGGLAKQRRNRKQFTQNDVAGLGPNELRNFRRTHHRKSTTTRTKTIASAASASRTIQNSIITTKTPQS